MTVVTRVYSVINDHCYPPGLPPGAQTSREPKPEDSDEETMTHAMQRPNNVSVSESDHSQTPFNLSFIRTGV